MKILQILPELNHGGVERGTIDLALALKAKGHEPYVVSNGGVLVKELEKAKIFHISLPVHKKSLSSLFLIGKLTDILIREKIDIVHARSRVPAWIAYFACKKARKKTGVEFITTCHGYYSTHFISKIMGWGKRVIVISNAIKNHMREHFLVPNEKMDLIYRGVDLSQFQFDVSKYQNMDSNKFNIIHIGRITALKGHTDFIRAFHLVHRKFPEARAWIVGGASSKRGKKLLAYLKSLVEELNLSEAVQFLGPRSDIPHLLSQAHLLVLSTRTPEGFGRVVVEAGASGTAVVATRVGGVSEIIDHEENGLLVPASDPVSLSKAIADLRQHPERCQQFASRLNEKVRDQFTLKQMFEKTIQVYERIGKTKKILFYKLGALGDLVLAIPSFRMIRNKYPDAFISLLVDERWMKVVENCPYLDEIIPFKRDKLWSSGFRIPAMVRQLKHRQFDISIDLQNTSKTHWLSFLAGIPERHGYKRGFSGLLLNCGQKGFHKTMPPLEHQFQLIQKLGVEQLDDQLELWSDPKDERLIQKILEKNWIHEGAFLVGFALGASNKWVTKRWPMDHFLELADKLEHKYQARIVLLGSAQDQPLADEFLKYHSQGVVNLVGKTSLGELFAVMKRLKLLVTPDSAPLHIGAASNVSVISFFGPTSPEKHIPPSSKIKTHWKKVDCSPCYSGTCSNSEQFKCMKEITVGEVMESVELLREGRDLKVVEK